MAFWLGLAWSVATGGIQTLAGPAQADTAGAGMRAGALQAGFDLGAGFGAVGFHTPRAHEIYLASAHLDRVCTPLLARDHWWRGHLEWLNEVFGGTQYYPISHYVAGVTTGLRYDFVTGTRWLPFVEGGFGLTATDIGPPDLSGNFQFNDQMGVGTYYFFRDDFAVTLRYRWMHLSNAGLNPPNHGINMQLFRVGLTWFF